MLLAETSKRRAKSARRMPELDPSVTGDRRFVEALSRGLELLSCFRYGDHLLGNQELAERCGLARSTVSRLTFTLTQLGYLVQQDPSGKYSLGTATLRLGGAMLARLDIRKRALPAMKKLAELSQSMVSLGARQHLSMIYVAVARGSGAATLSLDTGSRVKIATSAMGRAFLTAVPENERDGILARVYKQIDPEEAAKLRHGMAQALQDIETLGVCCSFGDWLGGVNAIAVPVRPGPGLPPMAINCGAPTRFVSKEFLLEEARPQLIALVRDLEISLASAA